MPHIRSLVRKAAIATGPKTNSHRIMDYIKECNPHYTPCAWEIGAYLTYSGIARPTGRIIGRAKEYEIIKEAVQ